MNSHYSYDKILLGTGSLLGAESDPQNVFLSLPHTLQTGFVLWHWQLFITPNTLSLPDTWILGWPLSCSPTCTPQAAPCCEPCTQGSLLSPPTEGHAHPVTMLPQAQPRLGHRMHPALQHVLGNHTVLSQESAVLPPLQGQQADSLMTK